LVTFRRPDVSVKLTVYLPGGASPSAKDSFQLPWASACQEVIPMKSFFSGRLICTVPPGAQPLPVSVTSFPGRPEVGLQLTLGDGCGGCFCKSVNMTTKGVSVQLFPIASPVAVIV